MARLVLRGAAMVMPLATVIWQVSEPTVIVAVLARVRQSDLDPLVADHDRASDGDPPPDGERSGQLWWPGGSGAGSAEPVPGGLRDGAGEGADRGAAGEDVRDRPVQPHSDALPGQWRSGADDVVADGLLQVDETVPRRP